MRANETLLLGWFSLRLFRRADHKPDVRSPVRPSRRDERKKCILMRS